MSRSLQCEEHDCSKCPDDFTECDCECHDDEEDEDFFDDDFDDKDFEDCGMTRDGTCDRAGSEECDECPFSGGL